MPNDDDYEVGYKKPPGATRFQKGKSGNPSGRPKLSKNRLQMIEELLTSKFPVRASGKIKHMTIFDIVRTQLAAGAAKGDMRAIRMLLELAKQKAESKSLVDGLPFLNGTYRFTLDIGDKIIKDPVEQKTPEEFFNQRTDGTHSQDED